MKSLLLTTTFSLFLNTVPAQTTLSGESFNKISVDGNAKILLRQDSACSVRFSENDKIHLSDVSIKNETLKIDGIYGGEITVALPTIKQVDIDGNGSITGQSKFTMDDLRLNVDGNGKITMDVNAEKINATINGYGKITLSGTAQDANFSIPGSGKIDASQMKTIRCHADISGVGKCMVDVVDELNTDISGTGTVTYNSVPKKLNENISGLGNIKDLKNPCDTCTDLSPDTTRIMLGDNNQLWFIEKKNPLHIKKKKSPKPIWRGFEMGINSYMDNGGTFTLSDGKENFDLRLEKSISIGLNLAQAQVELGHSNVWLFTGLGVTWNNYRFSSDVLLVNGSYTSAYKDTTPGVNHIKSKLVAVYLTAPVMMEFFTSDRKKHAFHLGAGGIFGLYLGAHAKQKIEIDGDVSKNKVFNDFNLSTFRYGFRVAVGYGSFNIFADYYASTLFKENQGPTLYPVNAGITFIGF